MCGLAAFSGEENFNIDKIKLLLTYNSLERGQDSIGTYSPLNGLYKKAGKPVDLIPKIELKEDNYFIGHVRSSTVGAKTDKNAHPFQFQELIGIMNGTTTNHWSLLTKYGLKPVDYDVDSEAIFAIIQKNQSFNVLGELIGSCAIICADTRNPNILYVYRNNDRPLFRGFIGNNMYISSIKESLEIIGCNKIDDFIINTLYTIVKGNITKTSSIDIKPYYSNYSIKLDISGKEKPSYSQIHNEHFVGRFMKFDSPNFQPTSLIEGFEDDKWYFCHSYNKTNQHEVIVKDKNNKSITISHRAFNCLISFPVIGEPIMILKDVLYGKRNKVVLKEGQLVKLVCYNKNSIEVREFGEDIKTTWVIGLKYARGLDYKETRDWKNEQESKEKSKVLEITSEIDKDYNSYIEEIYPQSDIITNNNSQYIPWTEGDNQLKLLPNTEETYENEILDFNEDDDIFMSCKEFKTIMKDIELEIDKLYDTVSGQVLYPLIKHNFTTSLNKIKDYIKHTKNKYLTV